MREEFYRELIESGILHKPLPLHYEGSFEEERKKVGILNRVPLLGETSLYHLIHDGEGCAKVYKENGEIIFSLTGTNVTYCWPEGMSPDGDYAFYGSVYAKFISINENWEKYHRLRFSVRPECDGNRITNIILGITNDGNIKVPDEYFREGSHVVELKNHEWNDCIWEFGSMPRDLITELSFACRLNGKDTASAETLTYYFKDIYLEEIESDFKDKGWECEDGKVAYAYTGYFTKGKKEAVTNRKEDIFYIISDDTGDCVLKEEVIKVSFRGENFGILDFSEVNIPGRYRIQIGDFRSEMFEINDSIYEEATWKVLNFIFCQRCGYPVPNKHGICHMDIVGEHEGKKVSFCGGWHDAGDLSQQAIQTAETAIALLQMADSVKKQTKTIERELLYQRLMEEGVWGIEFILRTRFGDGYRATSVGLVSWSNGFFGDEDDVYTRVHNQAMENLLCSAICSQASVYLEEYDRELSFKCMEVAKEDFTFGIKRYLEKGMELPIMWEHTYNSSKSLYAAVIVLAASNLYEGTHDKYYWEQALLYADYLLSCQGLEDDKTELKGVFFSDEKKEGVVHFAHQSREYLFMEALIRFIHVSPKSFSIEKYKEGIRSYASYLKRIMNYASPYKMIPAGIYEMREAEDKETFELLHLLVDYEKEKEHYKKQLLSGDELGNECYIKQFPVWFSFRGNTAIHLAMGRAAAIVGNYLKDEECLQIAREQLYWVNGKNPFRQSMIFGEGKRYCRQYAVMTGETVGEIPVGIETYEDEDIPYWPNTNNATYKEVWVTSAYKWLQTLAELMEERVR